MTVLPAAWDFSATGPLFKTTITGGWRDPSRRRRYLSGWHLNGIDSFQTGRPLAITTSVNSSQSFNGTERPNSTGVSAKLHGPVKDRLDRYFDTSQFTQPAAFTFGNLSRTLPDV